MSTVRWGAAMRAGALVILASLIVMLASQAASADPPAVARSLSADDARGAGLAVELSTQRRGGGSVVEVRLPNAAAESPEAAAGRLLAISDDGTMAAIADRLAPDRATLTLARADGSQLQVDLPGLVAAGFSPRGDWLAVVDGAGVLWGLDADDGQRRQLAEGPFLGPLTVLADDHILLQRVASVEAPFASALVRVDAASGAQERLSDEALVYDAEPLADGSLAVIAHRPEGTQLRRVRLDGADELIAELGAGAVNVSVSSDGSRAAWERHADGIYLLEVGSGDVRRLGSGSHPRFSPDGEEILVLREGRATLLSLDGRRLAALAGATAAFARCPEGCAP